VAHYAARRFTRPILCVFNRRARTGANPPYVLPIFAR
jgi:hypothetical protein